MRLPKQMHEGFLGSVRPQPIPQPPKKKEKPKDEPKKCASFKEWLEYRTRFEEGRRFRQRGSVGGAFGNDPSRRKLNKLKVAGQEEIGRGEISRQDTHLRVEAGKSIEALILKALADVSGWEIIPSSANEDMHRKIDGWRIDGGQKIPIQTKFRDSGDDIAVKVEWRGRPGRDLRGDAELYAVLDKAGRTIRVRSANQIKAVARRMLEQFNEKGRPKMLTLDTGQIRSAFDPHSGYHIVMAYIDPESPMLAYKEDFRLPKVIWQYRAA